MSDRSSPGFESTATLLELSREGNDEARQRLFERYLPMLRRWARGRLPAGARDAADTDDLVQVTLIRALRRVESFEPRREGAFLAYLRTILLNQVRSELRRASRRGDSAPLVPESLDTNAPSPVEKAIGRERFAAYESALAELPDRQREAVILRFEMGMSHREIADAVVCPSEDAARMLVARGVKALATRIGA